MADKKPNILVIWGDDIGITNLSWYHPYIIFAAQSIVASFLATVRDYPPRQKAASFTIDQAMAKMSDAASGAGR
jgi:arylsulfatase